MMPATRAQTRTVTSLLAVVLLAVALAGCMGPQERTFFDRTNTLRTSHGVRTVREQDTLTKKAEDWAQHMAATGVLAHSNLTSNLGGLQWTALGENVGTSTPTTDTLLTIHNKFLNSSTHRSNLLNAKYTHMGVGVATDRRGQVWVVEVFAGL